MAEEREVALYCDLHAHSMQRKVFMYGCSCESKEFNAIYRNGLIRVAPLLLSHLDSNFSYEFSQFQMEKCKESTARIVLFKEFNIVNSYTCEASFFGYVPRFKHRPGNSTHEYEKIGENLCKALLIYLPLKSLKSKLLELVKSVALAVCQNNDEAAEQLLLNKNSVAEMSAKEEVKASYVKICASKLAYSNAACTSEDLEQIKNVDVERLVEAVREKTSCQKTEEVDDDISSTDSEEERHKIILKKKLVRKKKRKNKKSRKAKPKRVVEELKPKSLPLTTIKASGITKIITRSELSRKAAVPDNRKIVPLCTYVPFLEAAEPQAKVKKILIVDTLRSHTSNGRKATVEEKLKPVKLSLNGLQVRRCPDTRRWLNSQASVTLGFLDESSVYGKSRVPLSRRYSTRLEPEDQGPRQTLEARRVQAAAKPRTVSTFSRQWEGRPAENCDYASAAGRRQKSSHEAKCARVVFAKNRLGLTSVPANSSKNDNAAQILS